MKKIKILVVYLLITVLLTGCFTNEYNEFSNEFLRIYKELSQSIDTSDLPASLHKLNSEENLERIDNMKVLLEGISEGVPEKNKEEYSKYIQWHEGLLLLKNSHNKWNDMSTEDKIIITGELIDIITRNN